jgi:2-polyprenyl-3-methyl-5-hydroxy-6-metoxy-1,4-benzoquinol methylase
MVDASSRSPDAGSDSNARKSQRATAYAKHHSLHRRYGFGYLAAERGAQFVAWIGVGKRVLDLGCRDGYLTRSFLDGNSITGVDIDREALALARQALAISTVWLDLNREPLPFEDSSFDVVVAGEVLEHLLDPAQVASDAHRVLVPGGQFVGSVPNAFHWRARLTFLRGHSREDPTHLHHFSLSALLAVLGAFKRVDVVPIGGVGGGVMPVLPPWLALPAVRRLPTLFANDFLFRAVKAFPSGHAKA